MSTRTRSAIAPDPDCRACDGTGLAAPCPFGNDPTPWWRYSCRAVRDSADHPGASAIRAGLLRPVPCPRCSQTRPN